VETSGVDYHEQHQAGGHRSLLLVAVRVDGVELGVALEQQLVPLVAVDAAGLPESSVGGWQALGRHVFVQGLAIGAMEDDPAAQLLLEEGLEQGKDHLENLRLVHDVNGLDPERNRVLQPVHNALGERRRKLPRLLETEAIHVEDHNGSADLCFWLQHGRLQEEHSSLEHLIEGDLLVLPALCNRGLRKINTGSAQCLEQL